MVKLIANCQNIFEDEDDDEHERNCEYPMAPPPHPSRFTLQMCSAIAGGGW